MTTIAPNTKPLPEIPYRGIESFRYIDQLVFCAREDETWDLLSHILINRGVLLYGDSGSGKSSLVNAGLIPAAIKENLYAHRLRVQPRRGREIKFERISTETDDGPPYLPSCIVDPAITDDKAVSFEISLLNFFRQLIRLRRNRTAVRPLLIFDQFEEFITLFEETSGQTSDGPKIQAEILKVLTRVLHDERFPVKILFVFREEYLAKLNVLFKSVPELLDQYVRLLPPRVDEAKKIIRAPLVAEELKERFAGKVNHVRELEQLAETIAAQIQQRSENGFINLTELQIVCRKLWESPDPAQYFQSNDSDIQKVLENYWADALNKLGDLYGPSIALLGHMITSTNTRNIVSEPDLKSFEKDNFTEDQITRSLNALVESRLVRREPRHKIYFYEIVSEFLVPWIRDKKAARLAQIEANRLAAEAKQKLKQVEKERRYVSIFAIFLGVLLIGAVYLIYLTYQSKQAVVKAQKDLRKERDRSQHLIDLLNQLTDENPKERLAAVNGLKNLNEATSDEEKLPRDLIPVIVAVTANDPDKEVSAAARYFFDGLSEIKLVEQSNSALTNSIIRTAEEKNSTLTETPPTISPPRVWFQLANENQRPRADKLAAALKSIGFTIPAYQMVGDRAPLRNELRWYQPANEADLASVTANRDKALQKCKEVDGAGWISKEFKTNSSVRPNVFELWFANDHAATTPTPTPTSTATPTPIPAKDIALRLIFINQQGKPIPYRDLEVELRSTTSAGRPLVGTSAMISAPPGIYILTVRIPDFKIYNEKVVLDGSEKEHKVVLESLPVIYKP